MSENEKWYDVEAKRLEDERQKCLVEKGLNPFLKMERGENHLTLVDIDKPPRSVYDEKFNRETKIFKVVVDGKEMDWRVNPKNPIYREIVNAIRNGTLELVVLQEGQGNATRYTIKSAKKAEGGMSRLLCKCKDAAEVVRG